MESVSNNMNEIEMFVARRSQRIANKEQQKLYEHNSDLTIKSKKKKVNKPVAKMNIDSSISVKGKIVKKRQNTGKVISHKLVNKFIDLEKTKISDVFSLVKKYSLSDKERQDKYVILQTILKGLKDMNIKNLLVDMYKFKSNIQLYLYSKLQDKGLTFISICSHIDEILSYKEIYELDEVIGSHMNVDCDSLVESMNKIDIKSVEHQMRQSINEIDELNSMIFRLMM
jgi:hypothetical protein